MAEALAVIGLVSAIVQFVDFGTKVVHRFHEFHERAGEVPNIFQNLHTRLPLVLDVLRRIKAQVDDGRVHEDTQRALLPVVQSCFEQIEQLNEILIKVSPVIDDSSWRRGTKALLSVGQEGKIKKIEETLNENIHLLTFHQVTTSTVEAKQSAPTVFMVHYERDNRFINRKSILDEVDLKFRNQRRVALAGLGGVGFREKNPKASVFWLHGSVDRFPQAYREIARRADIPVANGDPLELVTEWLNDPRSGQWLLVIDNADDVSTFFGSKSKITESRENLKPLARYVPHGSNGFILITTRDSRVGERLCNREKPIQVLPMNAAEAEDLLRSKISDDLWVEEDARELLQDLAYLPLAITQAAAFISENNQTISEYLRILRMGDGDLQDLLSVDLEDPRRDLDTENSVMRTWKISFDQILKEKPRAADVLSLMAVLERSGVPEVLLRSTGESETGFKTALGTLQAFSLITGDKGKSLTFSMHRLVQLTTQKWLELRGGLSRWQAEALRVLSVVYPEPSYQTWVECESFAPHVQLVLSYPFPSDAAALHRANLLSKRCMFEFDMGRLHTSQEDGSEARTLHERLCSEDDPVLLRDLYLHGIWHESQGDNVQAKELFARAASGFEKVLGIAHKYTSESIQNLGCVLVRLGEYEAAEKVITRALDTQEKLCGPNARSVLLCMQSLGSLMMARDDFEGAEKILREARKRYEVTLGSDHVETLDCLTLLAIVLTEEWNPEAVSLLETVVDALENKLGPNQMETIRAIVRLSEAICIMSDNDAAEALLRGALVRQDSLHTPGSLILLHQLGVVLQRQLRLEESERMYRKVVAEEERVFGKEDANTLCTLTNLAQVLVDTGPERYAEAEGILREALVVWEATRGKSNETAIRWRTVLRNLLKLQDKQEEAASLIEGFDETQLPDNTKESGSRTMRQWAFAIPGRGGV